MKYEGKLCIDVSENNGDVDFQAIADAGIEYVMVRTSFGKSDNIDSRFIENVNKAHAAGLKVGGYHYSYALSPEDIAVEAESCARMIAEAGVPLELPVFLDMEDADHWKEQHGWKPGENDVTGYCKVWLDNFPLNTGVYASLDWLESYIDWKSLGCAVWNAEWIGNGSLAAYLMGERPFQPSDDSIKGMIWQFTDSYPIGERTFDANLIYVPVEEDGE